MSAAARMVAVTVDGARAFQPIDGFGVNINARYWGDGALAPVVDDLIDDLGATLFRVDIWGTCDWPDPDGSLGLAALEPDRLAAIYAGPVFAGGWALIRHLNGRGIAPYLTCSGIVPRWMCAEDGRTLGDVARYSAMVISQLRWAVEVEKLQIGLFCPLNETDIGPPEGPALTPAAYAAALAQIARDMDAAGLPTRLVAAEQASFDDRFIAAIRAEPDALRRVAVWGLHTYGTIAPETYAAVARAAADTPLWMTEYGDLDQSGEKEWYVAWIMTERLLGLLSNGFRAALAWDAFDNYHDHDRHWTLYGLLRTGLRVFTPKLRYYAARQVFAHVRPGWERVACECADPQLRALAFADAGRGTLTVVAMNAAPYPVNLNIALSGFDHALRGKRATISRTSEHERGVTVGSAPVTGPNWPFSGIDVVVPPASIVTIATC